ncbi:MAG TPA: hypothetical protein VH141_09695 [Pseudonocardia sp.]|jgi:hypothetical protein|nr:hypothetical protein [Pseudonocardia sp.]
MKYRKLAPVLAAGMLALLAGCNNSSSDQDQPPPAPAASTPPSAPAAAPPAAPGPIVGLHPLSPAQKQQRDFCQQGIVKNGCEFYTDDSLRLQGFDPDS